MNTPELKKIEIVDPSEVVQVAKPYMNRPEQMMHWGFFAMGIAILLMSLLMKSEGQSAVFLPGASIPMSEVCSSKILFGTDCPGCGLTRAFISISHGQFLRAWRFNPGSFPVYLFLVGQIPWQALQFLRMRLGKSRIESNWLFLVPAVAGASLIIQWIVKIVSTMS